MEEGQKPKRFEKGYYIIRKIYPYSGQARYLYVNLKNIIPPSWTWVKIEIIDKGKENGKEIMILKVTKLV